jgi:predicted DNA-binding transcriptional regulator YafY
MSINKLALIRYKVLDDCLRNKRRKWTLDDLMEKVADVLYEKEGIDTGVSKRTIQADIQLMRSDKLGYNAPIIVKAKKYYTYSDESYSITNAPINQSDVDKMKEIVGVLKQLNGFSYFDEMSEMIARLENNLYTSMHQSRNCIQFEDNKQLKGLQYITPLYQAILNKRPLSLIYQSFKAQQPQEIIVYPYLLKEYRNRWFLVAKQKDVKYLLTLALDRIVAFDEGPGEKFVEHDGIDFDVYFNDLLGVSKNEKDIPHKVLLWIDKTHAPYVMTKPLHHSQTIIKETTDGVIVRIEVILNVELEREILGFGEFVKVLSPRLLVGRVNKRLSKAVQRYMIPNNKA